MKDNLPNYLNPHNIDPSRVEPAHIDTPPGNDSIRPGMNIGTVAVVGKGRPKLQLPTMSNAEAIKILEKIETDIYGRIAISKAIDALRSPWVKTADRLPDDDDPVPVIYVGYTDNLPHNDAIAVYAYKSTDNYAGAWYWQDSDGIDYKPVSVSITHWLPIPPLPEVEK